MHAVALVTLVGCETPAPEVGTTAAPPVVTSAPATVASATISPEPPRAPGTAAPLPVEEPTEPAYRTLRGRLNDGEFVSIRAALIDDGSGNQRLDFYDRASNPARGACHPGGREWETRMISLQSSDTAPREPLFRVDATTTERDRAIVVAHEWESEIVKGARFRVRLTRLDRDARMVEGTVQVTSRTARIEGPFVARWCGVGRADPRPKPVVGGVEWNPDAVPAFARILATPVEGTLGGRAFRPSRAVISRDARGFWSLALHDAENVDPCAPLDFRVAGVFFALSTETPAAGFELVRRHGDPGDLRTGLAWDPEPGRHHSRSVFLSAVRIDEIADDIATGRIYVADDDENRTLIAGGFRATTCGL